MPETHLSKTPLLNFDAPSIQRLVTEKQWGQLPEYDRIGAIYDFVRNDIAFGYNRADNISASEVLADGYGQCNTKGTLLMALFRAVGISCRLHGFTIEKALQRGVVPEIAYALAPANIVHSWVEVHYDGRWIALEGFILDDPFIKSMQHYFPDRNGLCGYGIGTETLKKPDVKWCGRDTYIQSTGINQDFGVFNSPDEFYRNHSQGFGFIRNFLYKNIIRHWMNRRVRGIRNGVVPDIPGGPRPPQRTYKGYSNGIEPIGKS